MYEVVKQNCYILVVLVYYRRCNDIIGDVMRSNGFHNVVSYHFSHFLSFFTSYHFSHFLSFFTSYHFSSVCVKTLARIYFIIVEFSPPYALPKRQ